VRAMGIRDRPTSYRSPWQNGYVERLIGSIRRECTDHLLVFNVEHLRRILSKYASYYNEARTHVSLREGRALQTANRTIRRHCRIFNPWRTTPSIRSNLVFRSDTFPRFVQHAIWRYCAENGLDVCNGNRINDDIRCDNVYCQVRGMCDRVTQGRHKVRATMHTRG
jgi:Integrase core domain